MFNRSVQQSQRPPRSTLSAAVSPNSSDIYECRIRERANKDWVRIHRENAERDKKAAVETHLI